MVIQTAISSDQQKALTIVREGEGYWNGAGYFDGQWFGRSWREMDYEASKALLETLLVGPGLAAWTKLPAIDQAGKGRSIKLTNAGRVALFGAGAPKEYWWVSVGGNSCEPAVWGKEGLFTLGCPDPHDPDTIAPMEPILTDRIPDSPKEAAKADREYRKQMAGRSHGYRKFG